MTCTATALHGLQARAPAKQISTMHHSDYCESIDRSTARHSTDAGAATSAGDPKILSEPKHDAGPWLAFDSLRYPMAVLVVIIHYNLLVFKHIPYGQVELSIRHCATWAQMALSYVACIAADVAVPTFFLISGYLVFYRVERFDRATYTAKLRRRAQSLLVPYLVWNLIAYFALHSSYSLKSLLLSFSFFPLGVYGLNHPADLPLWFVRDLMALSLASPLVWAAVKRWGCALPLAALAFWWVGRGPIWVIGFSSVAVCFYAIGAWAAIGRHSVTSWAARPQVLAAAAAVWVVASVADLATFHYVERAVGFGKLNIDWLHHTAILAGVALALGLASRAAHGSRRTLTSPLARHSFMVFALHIVLLPHLMKAVGRLAGLVAPYSAPMLLAMSATMVLLAVLLCTAASALVARVPLLPRLLTGGR